MSFDIKDKVALITGGASGIGLRYVKELLRNDLRAVTLADVNDALGKTALEEIEQEFGPSKAIYVKTDVTDKSQVENAFDKTIEAFKNIDILINNAGILNDSVWEKEIAINLNGTIYGILLGLEKLPKYRSGPEAVIANIASIVGLKPFASHPVYTATKFGVQSMTRAFGDDFHYQRHKVKFVTMCPGVTNTPLISEISGRNLGPEFEEIGQKLFAELPTQEPEFVAKAMVEIIRDGKSGSVWVAEGNESYELEFPSRAQMRKN